ncbi:hypothetical protein MTO96_021588 [Rhipicephalus appendiculatus]
MNELDRKIEALKRQHNYVDKTEDTYFSNFSVVGSADFESRNNKTETSRMALPSSKACERTQNLSSAPRERQTTEGKGQNPEAAATWRDSGVQTKKAVIGEMEAPSVADQNESYALINASRQSDVESPSTGQ